MSSTRFSLVIKNGRADAGGDGRTFLARPNCHRQTGTGGETFSLLSLPGARLPTTVCCPVCYICEDHFLLSQWFDEIKNGVFFKNGYLCFLFV